MTLVIIIRILSKGPELKYLMILSPRKKAKQFDIPLFHWTIVVMVFFPATSILIILRHLSKVTLHLSEEAARSIIIFSTAYFVVP